MKMPERRFHDHSDSGPCHDEPPVENLSLNPTLDRALEEDIQMINRLSSEITYLQLDQAWALLKTP